MKTFITILLVISFNSYASIETTFFNKSFDIAKLKKLLPLKLKTMVHNLRSTPLDVFSLDPNFKKRSLPTKIKAEWDRKVQENRKKGQPLSGIYIRSDFDFNGYKHSKDLLILGKGITRSITIHEYHHYLFQVERKKRPNYITREKLEMNKRNALQAFGKAMKNPKNIVTFKKRANELIDAMLTALKQSSIEEVLIGYYLVKHFKSGKFITNYRDILTHTLHALQNIEFVRRPFMPLRKIILKIKDSNKTIAKVDSIFLTLDKLQTYLNNFLSSAKTKCKDGKLEKELCMALMY